MITLRARTAVDNVDSVLMLVLNPAWPHFVGGFSIILACILGVTRFLLGGKNFPFEERIYSGLNHILQAGQTLYIAMLC